MFTVFNSSPPPNRPHHALGGLATHAELRVYKRHSVLNQASTPRHSVHRLPQTFSIARFCNHMPTDRYSEGLPHP